MNLSSSKGTIVYILLTTLVLSALGYIFSAGLTGSLLSWYVQSTGGVARWQGAGERGLFLAGVGMIATIVGLIISIPISYFVLRYYVKRVRGSSWQAAHPNLIFTLILAFLLVANLILPQYFN